MLRRVLPALLLSLCAAAAHAQTGTVAGRVTDRGSGAPIPGASVSIEPSPGTVGPKVSGTSDANGGYSLAVAPGRYSVVVRNLGHRQEQRPVIVGAGLVQRVDVALTHVATSLEQVVVTVNRLPQKVLNSPASVQVQGAEQVQRRVGATVIENVRAMPGVDATQGGIVQSNVVGRGFNNAFSGAMLMMQDYRFAGVPSLRVNVPFLFTGTNEDIERVEVLLGPAAALYGPNSANGVMHIITKSPFASKGTTLTVDGGQQSILRGALRHAGSVSDKLGFKFSGEIFRGRDWQYRDPAEPATFPSSSIPARRGLPNARDYDVERQTGEARLDIRPTLGTELVTTYGITNVANMIELTGANGAAQVRDWKYQNLQQRFRWNRLFAQVFVNFSDAGNSDSLDTQGTFLLRTGQPIVDRSFVAVGQLQHALSFGERQTFIYGADYIATNPRTQGTTHGLNEDDDQTREVGGYLHSVTKLAPKWELTTAARLDHHDRIDGLFFSPRAALQFTPTDRHALRVTYNRAYSTPGTFQMFLDLPQAATPFATVRAIGVNPEQGIAYDRGCAGGVGGFCMRTTTVIPATLGSSAFFGPNAHVDANAAAFFPLFVGSAVQGGLATGLVQQFVAAGVPQANAQALAGAIVNRLLAARPTAQQVGTVLRAFNPTTAAQPGGNAFPEVVNPTSLRDLEPLKPTFVSSIEAGFKGDVGNRVRLSLDAWYQQRKNFITPAAVLTPNAFVDPTTLGAYIGQEVVAAIGSSLPAAVAAQVASGVAAQIATGAARVPLGTVTGVGRLYERPDVLFTYRNIDKTLDIFGSDVGAEVVVTDLFSVLGTFSWVSDDRFEGIQGGNGTDLFLNAPKYKGSFTTRWQDDTRGWGWELRGRYVDAFTVNSAVYYGRVPVGAFLDAGVNTSFGVGGKTMRFSINGTNLFDRRVPTFVGVPEVGRLVLTRLQYEF